MSDYHLFLDDFRDPLDVTWADLPAVEWSIVRSVDCFKKWINKFGLPSLVSFDHDLLPQHYKPFFNTPLPTDGTGFEACEWLVQICEFNSLEFPKWIVHSQNSRAVTKMVDFLVHKEISWNKGITWSYK